MSGNNLLSQLNDNVEFVQELMQEREELLLKAGTSNDPSVILKAQNLLKEINKKPETETKTFVFDPLNYSENLKYKNHNSSVSYNSLRRMSKAPVIESIISTRIEQISSFSQPQPKEYSPGFIIRKKKRIGQDEEPKLTRKDYAIVEYLTEFIINCGSESNIWVGHDFDEFLRMFTRDSLELDQGCFEIVRNRKGIPSSFFITDGATIRKSPDYNDPKFLKDRYNSQLPDKILGYYPTHVQLMNHDVIAEMYPWELCFGIRNPQSNIYSNGYGKSELETLIQTVTWMLYSDQYNGKFFSQGSSPKGILKIKGATNQARLHEFRQQWMAMVQGVENAWRVPVLNSDEAEWIDLQKNNTDMQFQMWQEYLIRLSCAIFKIAPEEIGFDISNSSQGGNTFESKNETKLKYSRDKGLKPLLRFIAKKINKFVISPINPEFEFVFVGLEEDEQSELDNDIKKVGSFMTINEIRAKRNLKPIPDGDIINNAVFMQGKNASMMGGLESNEYVDNEEGEGVDKESEKNSILKSFYDFHNNVFSE